DRVAHVAGRLDVEAVAAQVRAERAQDRGLVVDDQHAGAAFGHRGTAPTSSGSVMTKRAPVPGPASTQMRPPCAPPSRPAIARPRPAPFTGARSPRRKRWNGANTVSRSSPAMP